jgi:hypothetical protein
MSKEKYISSHVFLFTLLNSCIREAGQTEYKLIAYSLCKKYTSYTGKC